MGRGCGFHLENKGIKTLKTAAIKKEMYDLDMVKGQVRQTLQDCG